MRRRDFKGQPAHHRRIIYARAMNGRGALCSLQEKKNEREKIRINKGPLSSN